MLILEKCVKQLLTSVVGVIMIMLVYFYDTFQNQDQVPMLCMVPDDSAKFKMPNHCRVSCIANNDKRWEIMKQLLQIFKEISAPYMLSEGSLLYLYRNCSLGSSDIDFSL